MRLVPPSPCSGSTAAERRIRRDGGERGRRGRSPPLPHPLPPSRDRVGDHFAQDSVFLCARALSAVTLRGFALPQCAESPNARERARRASFRDANLSPCLITRPIPDLPTLTARLRARQSYAPAEEHAGAAVATVFRPGAGSPEVLLIERARREGDPWSGHIAFPGGKRDAGDPSLLATALRETTEEVGLRLTPSSLLTRFDDFFARSNGYQVAQLVFALDDDGGPLAPNAEVATVLWTPLSVLVAPENEGTFHFEHDGLSMELPCVRIGQHVLWGMTYRMLQALLEAVVT